MGHCVCPHNHDQVVEHTVSDIPLRNRAKQDLLFCWVTRIKRITPQKIGMIRPLNSKRQVYIHELIALNKANFWALAHFKVICSVALTIVLSKQADGDGKEHTTNSSLIDGYNLGISCIKYYYIEDHC